MQPSILFSTTLEGPGSAEIMAGLPDAMAQPGFAVASGLLRYGLVPDRQATNLGQLIAGAGHDAGYFRRVGQWLKESF